MGTVTNNAIQNLLTCEDRQGNHYWIFDILHTTGDDTNIEVPQCVLSAAEIPADAATAVDVTIVNTTSNDAVREIQIDTAVATATYKIIARFRGSAAGMGSITEAL
jgi:hypothetical protein